MTTLYRKVQTSERLPEKEGTFLTDCGELDYFPEHKSFLVDIRDMGNVDMNPDWWLEPVDLPTDDEVRKHASEDSKEMWAQWHNVIIEGTIRTVGESAEIEFINGADYILNKIKGY